MTVEIRDQLANRGSESQEQVEELIEDAGQDFVIMDRMFPSERNPKLCPPSTSEMSCFQPTGFTESYCYVQQMVFTTLSVRYLKHCLIFCADEQKTWKDAIA